MPFSTSTISNSGETPDNPKTAETHLDTLKKICQKALEVNGKAEKVRV
jgi:hypothetical protein